MKIELTNPKLITWARERAGFDIDQLAAEVKISPDQLKQIEQGQKIPSKAQLDCIAAKTYVPLGFLVLSQPPREELPVPDFRTEDSQRPKRISADLWDSIHSAQAKQDWYRDYLIRNDAPKLPFIHLHKQGDRVEDIAKSICKHLGIETSIEDRPGGKDKEAYLKNLMTRAEQAGILIIRSGVVHNNSNRRLDPQEFRGFALCDDYAPVIFINNNDYQAAQVFTLAHELAHLFLGTGGLNDPMAINNLGDENLCNQVAAELLVPKTGFRSQWKNSTADFRPKIKTFAEEYRVSRAVIARCALSHRFIPKQVYWQWWQEETQKRRRKQGGSGGNFYALLRWRSGGKIFSLALDRSVQNMETSYKKAFRLLNIKGSTTTFTKYMEYIKKLHSA